MYITYRYSYIEQNICSLWSIDSWKSKSFSLEHNAHDECIRANEKEILINISVNDWYSHRIPIWSDDAFQTHRTSKHMVHVPYKVAISSLLLKCFSVFAPIEMRALNVLEYQTNQSCVEHQTTTTTRSREWNEKAEKKNHSAAAASSNRSSTSHNCADLLCLCSSSTFENTYYYVSCVSKKNHHSPLVSKPKRTYYIIAIYLLNLQLNTVWNKAYVVCLSIADPRNW